MASQNDRAAAHMTFWQGEKLAHLYPQLQPPQDRPRRLLSFNRKVTDLLGEVAVTGMVDVAALSAVTAKEIYVDIISSPPPPRIESKQPDINWTQAWPRVWAAGLLAAKSDFLFRLLHNVLPVKARIT